MPGAWHSCIILSELQLMLLVSCCLPPTGPRLNSAHGHRGAAKHQLLSMPTKQEIARTPCPAEQGGACVTLISFNEPTLSCGWHMLAWQLFPWLLRGCFRRHRVQLQPAIWWPLNLPRSNRSTLHPHLLQRDLRGALAPSTAVWCCISLNVCLHQQQGGS